MRTLRTPLLVLAAGVAFIGGAAQLAAAPAEKVTVCHKPGTPDEAVLSVGAPAVAAHLAHGDSLGPCVVDQIIDADGIATTGDGVPGAVEVQVGDALTAFPDGGVDAGLDMFDQDSNGAWTQGVDDLHVEDPSACSTAVRDGDHDLGADCKVLDLNGDLGDQEPVDCDISVGLSFSGMVCPPPDVKFHDADGNGSWSPGEDLVLDVNGNGVYD
ncbi:MAG: hypothetical protein ACRD2W_10270 [Acidimicrobiales bacterium]